MKNRKLLRFSNSSRISAFSLVELLVVLAIIVVLVGLTVPAFNSIAGSGKLSSAGMMVVADINRARQTSITEHKEIELRFYRLPNTPGGTSGYNALQIINTINGQAINNINRLPDAVIMMDAAKYSTILSAPNDLDVNNGTADLPGYGNVNYKAIRFRSNGALNLDPRGADHDAPEGADEWFITLKLDRDPPTTGELPSNDFITVQVDPVTGRTRTFRP